MVGRERKIVIDKYTGKSAVASRLDQYGIEVDPMELEKIVQGIKELGDQRKQVFDTDIIDIAEKVTKRDLDVIPRDINALIMLEVESFVFTAMIVRKLRSFDNISRVYEISGDYDISTVANVENIAELNNLIDQIRNMRGVKRTDTRIVLKKYNGDGNNGVKVSQAAA